MFLNLYHIKQYVHYTYKVQCSFLRIFSYLFGSEEFGFEEIKIRGVCFLSYILPSCGDSKFRGSILTLRGNSNFPQKKKNSNNPLISISKWGEYGCWQTNIWESPEFLIKLFFSCVCMDMKSRNECVQSGKVWDSASCSCQCPPEAWQPCSTGKNMTALELFWNNEIK